MSIEADVSLTDPPGGEPVAGRGAADPERRVQRGGGVRRAARAGGVRGAAAARRAVPPGAPAAGAGRVERVPGPRARRAAAPRPQAAHHPPAQELQRDGAQHRRRQGTRASSSPTSLKETLKKDYAQNSTATTSDSLLCDYTLMITSLVIDEGLAYITLHDSMIRSRKFHYC